MKKYLLILGLVLMMSAVAYCAGVSRTIDISQDKMTVRLRVHMDENNNIVSCSYTSDLNISYVFDDGDDDPENNQVIKNIIHKQGSLTAADKDLTLGQFLKGLKNNIDLK